MNRICRISRIADISAIAPGYAAVAATVMLALAALPLQAAETSVARPADSAAVAVVDSALNPPAARSSDQAIVADQQAYALWQGRIKALNDKGVKVADYYLSKAQCWLDVSLHEYTRNDRSAFPAQALGQGAAIIEALEAQSAANPGQQTPLVNDATRLRDDLWARFAALKQGPGFACAAQKIACAEVELVHAGNEYRQQGWRHANPYIQIAEDLLQQADNAAADCQRPAALPVPATPAAAPVCQPAPNACPDAPRVSQRLMLAADALFLFDKHALPDLLPAGRAKIDEMLQKLDQVYQHIDSITLTGFTDRLGAVVYNQKLSQRRADTVRQYLQEKGFKGQIKADGKGKAEQLVACNGVQSKEKLIACLQPNRRVVIEVVGVKR